jgi:hypothetical protein
MRLECDHRRYQVTRSEMGVIATVDGRPLPPRTDLCNHSSTGFEFGYAGSGPAQLALAILADCIGEPLALEFYQEFKWAVIAQQRGKAFTLTERDVREAVVAIRQARVAPLAQRN